ncbi:hypothetical protein LXA43DRAFT_1063296 [Ganoderma leucocontextum]|nr:hypothetical protein LXA43DRAFT_1063296 [Ganoderma leucocontextum]
MWRKDLWVPDALSFDPERFLDQRVQKCLTPNPFIFLPFNGRPRICLGHQVPQPSPQVPQSVQHSLQLAQLSQHSLHHPQAEEQLPHVPDQQLEQQPEQQFLQSPQVAQQFLQIAQSVQHFVQAVQLEQQPLQPSQLEQHSLQNVHGQSAQHSSQHEGGGEDPHPLLPKTLMVPLWQPVPTTGRPSRATHPVSEQHSPQDPQSEQQFPHAPQSLQGHEPVDLHELDPKRRHERSFTTARRK